MTNHNLKGHFVGLMPKFEYVDGINWKLINPDDGNMFSFILDDGRSITPSDGFITDFASIPRIVQNILPPAGNGPTAKYGLGAIIHDVIYRSGKINGVFVSRHVADHVLKACNESVNVDRETTNIIHNALVIGGQKTWDEYRRKSYV